MLLFGAVAFAPVPFGSTAPAAIAVWCIVLGVALLLARPVPHRNQLPVFATLAAVLAAYAVVVFAQLSPRPWFGLAAEPIWKEMATVLRTDVSPGNSSVRNQPVFALGGVLVSTVAFATAYVVCADRDRGYQLLTCVSWSGTAIAIFGIAQHVLTPGMLLWRAKLAYLSSLTGTFINRNTAAAYFGSCAVVTLLLLLRSLSRHRRAGTWRARRLLDSFGAKGLPPSEIGMRFAALSILIIAMFLTASRAGVLCSLVGMVLAFALYRMRDVRRRKAFWVSSALGIIAAVGSLQFLGGSVGARIDRFGLTDAARFDVYRSTLDIIADHPWLGTGLGTFPWSFPPYRSSFFVWGTYDRAHNTLLEIAAEGGLPLAIVVALAWVLLIVALARGAMTRRRNAIFPLSGLAVAVIAGLHSLVDFSLQIPGYAVVAFAIMGCGVGHAARSRADGPDLG